MYVTIRKYAEKAALIDGLMPSVRDGFRAPAQAQRQGSRATAPSASEDGHVRLGHYLRRRAVERPAGRRSGPRMGGVQPQRPTAQPAGGHRPARPCCTTCRSCKARRMCPGMYATVRVYDGVLPKEEVRCPWITREHAVPARSRGRPGSAAFTPCSTSANASRAVSVSLYDTREHAMAAQQRMGSVTSCASKRFAPEPADRHGRAGGSSSPQTAG